MCRPEYIKQDSVRSKPVCVKQWTCALFNRCDVETLKMGQRRVQSDIYALGVVFWQMWTTKDPNATLKVAALPYRDITRHDVSSVTKVASLTTT